MLRILLFPAFAGVNAWVLLVLVRFLRGKFDELRDPDVRRRAAREFALDELGNRLFLRFPNMANPVQQAFLAVIAVAALLVADYFTMRQLWPELLGHVAEGP